MYKIVCLLFALLCLGMPAKADVIGKVYTTLQNDYINNISNRKITFKGLKALTKTDAGFAFKASNDTLYLYYNHQRKGVFALPLQDNNAAEWADLSRKVINMAIKLSPDVELYDYEISDRFAQEVFAGLDGYSHYFGGFDDERQLEVKRNFAARKVDDNVLLIKIVSFQNGVSDEVADALSDCDNCQGLILDLRGNHGGVLNEALKIADMFLDEGIVTYTAAENGQTPQYYTASAGDVWHNKPMAVLVDGFTASAAEVLAAALSEQNRALLVGTQTFGKGTVQNVVKMGEGRAMALTKSYFFTPSGGQINGEGLNPAVCTGGLKRAENLTDATCQKEDRFNQETDVIIAADYIKNEM